MLSVFTLAVSGCGGGSGASTATAALGQTPITTAESAPSYQDNLAKILASSPRNTEQDQSPYINTRMTEMAIGPLLGPREDYIRGDDGVVPGLPGGNPEPNFAATGVGTFRIACEFSHFAYDDPIVHPGKPGAAHLHMFWGNTHANALSTYETLLNSGSSTCNGMELNRTGYWAPAMFDARGNVRIPERIIVYYKGYGLANGASQMFPPRAAMVIDDLVHRSSVGGAIGEQSFVCTDQFRGNRNTSGPTIPVCKGNDGWRRVLEMHVKFPNCWNRQDASKPENWHLAKQGGWFFSDCQGSLTVPNIEYIIAYPMEENETTEGWYLSSDVSAASLKREVAGGSTVHSDWWGAWHPQINQTFLDNCVNLKKDGSHGCGFGYLSDAGPDDDKPFPGPALKYRKQYAGPIKVPATNLYSQLCDSTKTISSPEQAAYCKPTADMKVAALSRTAVCKAPRLDSRPIALSPFSRRS